MTCGVEHKSYSETQRGDLHCIRHFDRVFSYPKRSIDDPCQQFKQSVIGKHCDCRAFEPVWEGVCCWKTPTARSRRSCSTQTSCARFDFSLRISLPRLLRPKQGKTSDSTGDCDSLALGEIVRLIWCGERTVLRALGSTPRTRGPVLLHETGGRREYYSKRRTDSRRRVDR